MNILCALGALGARATAVKAADTKHRASRPLRIDKRLKKLMKTRNAKFHIGQVVKHRIFPFRGVIFDVDPEFDNTEEWWNAIPADVRPRKDQPFYHLFAENAETEYIAYVSEQNLLPDDDPLPIRHPQVRAVFDGPEHGVYRPRGPIGH
jgi:heat shock protein HspQ